MDKFLGIADKEVIFLSTVFYFKMKAFRTSQPIVLGFNIKLKLKSFAGHNAMLCQLALKMCSVESHVTVVS